MKQNYSLQWLMICTQSIGACVRMISIFSVRSYWTWNAEWKPMHHYCYICRHRSRRRRRSSCSRDHLILALMTKHKIISLILFMAMVIRRSVTNCLCLSLSHGTIINKKKKLTRKKRKKSTMESKQKHQKTLNSRKCYRKSVSVCTENSKWKLDFSILKFQNRAFPF